MKKKLIIAGAGGFGREVYCWAQQAYDFQKEWEFKGFLDDNPKALDSFDYPGDILASVDAYTPQNGDFFLCALGDPKAKKTVIGKLLEKGAEFTTLIHPSVVIGGSVSLGRGVILCPGVILTTDIVVEDFVSLNCHTAVGHDARIGAYSQTSSFCDLTGYTELGEGVFLGSHASVLPSVKVGEGAFIGAGSVVTARVKPNARVFGVPARNLTF